ncbi:MAG: GspH/FimT family pseudopilin [Lamprocystis purpurea]|uniref:GspH/FimT family pseudopilin n=1 Tax=Lamprocystis purpurea TaxID=61598 RepID=UPI0012F9C384|nr:GspH/FimT family pseudopilin [Lamprocystis purpurea]MBV5272705.1 GspH/FimT family pseudopilin [Lamprocystis purpurea]
MKTLKYTHGVTLIELMITLSMIAVTLGLGVPTFQNFQVGMQRAQVIAELVTSLTLARSEAARRGGSVEICVSQSGTACSTSDDPGWHHGWVVFADTDQDNTIDPDEIIHIARFEHPTFSLTGDISVVGGIVFDSTGCPEDTGTFSYCDEQASREIDLNYIGRLKIVESDSGCS